MQIPFSYVCIMRILQIDIKKKVCSLVACAISTTRCCQGTCVAQTMVPCSCQNVNVHVLKVPGFILE